MSTQPAPSPSGNSAPTSPTGTPSSRAGRSLPDRARLRVAQARARSRIVDHGVRAHERWKDVDGSRLSAAVSYFGFLSFFPLVALAMAGVGYVVVVWPQAESAVTSAIAGALPGIVGPGPGQIQVSDFAGAKAGAGILGLLGLLYAGLGWVDAVRDSLREVFGAGRSAANVVHRKVSDVGVLALLGLALLASLLVSSAATSATRIVLGWVGLDESMTATVVLKILAVAAALLLDVLVFGVLLVRLSGARPSWGRVRAGALLGAVGFEVLKLLGTFLVVRTTRNPVYGAFAITIGLLVWIHLVTTLLVFVACWTATTPGDPSGEKPGQPVAPGLLLGATSATTRTTDAPARVARGRSARAFAAGALGGVVSAHLFRRRAERSRD